MTAVAPPSESVAPALRRGRSFATGLILAVVLLGIGLLVWIVVTPARPAGDASAVSGAFLGYTNDAAGNQIVMIRINNRSPIAIRRQRYYEVQVLTNGTWKPQPTVHLPYAHGPLIPPHQSEIWTINAPATESRWRLWFPYGEDHGRLREMKKAIRRELRDLGLRFEGSEPTYQGEPTYTGLTDVVEPPQGQ